MLYVFATSFFVAFLTIDVHRQRANRDACIGFKHSSSWQALSCSNQMYFQQVMRFLSKYMLTIPGKFFPTLGGQSYVYMGEVNYYADQWQLQSIYEKLKAEPTIIASSVVSWYHNYMLWIENHVNKSSLLLNELVSREEDFYTTLLEYLSTDGATYQTHIKYEMINNKMKIKIFFLVVSVGLFHGLVYLPIFLSIIGPRPYRINIDNIKTDKRKMKDKSSLDTSSDTLASPGTSRPATVLVNNNNLSTESILNATSENNKPQVDENGVDNGTYVNAEA